MHYISETEVTSAHVSQSPLWQPLSLRRSLARNRRASVDIRDACSASSWPGVLITVVARATQTLLSYSLKMEHRISLTAASNGAGADSRLFDQFSPDPQLMKTHISDSLVIASGERSLARAFSQIRLLTSKWKYTPKNKHPVLVYAMMSLLPQKRFWLRLKVSQVWDFKSQSITFKGFTTLHPSQEPFKHLWNMTV